MKKYLIIVLVIIIVAAGIATYILLNKNTETAGLQKIRVNEVTRSVFYAPQYVAISKGYFAEEGYTQVFAQMTQKDGSFLVSKEKTDNFSWQDLKGKTVIPGRKGGVPYMTFEYVLKQNGLDPKKDLVLDDSIKFDLMAGAFAGGNAEYVTLFEPTASATEKAGKGYIVASVGEASGEIPYTAYFAKKSYIEKNPNIIQGFTNAIYKGEQWVKSHSAKEIAEAIVDFFPDTDLTMLEAALQSYIDIDAWRDNPVLKQESFALLQKVMKEAGELEKEADYGKVVNNSFAEKAIQKLGK